MTSVALTVPSFLSVSGSPVTTSGTLAVSLATEPANTVFAGPTSGGAATPTFRALVVADVPTLNQNTTGSAGSVSGTNVITNSNLAQMPTLTIHGNNTGGTGNVLNLTVAQVNTMLGDVTTMGAFGATPNANGASISGNTLTLQPADSTNPGGVSTATQVFAGSKTLGAAAADIATIGAASSTAKHFIRGGVNYTTKTITAATYTVDTTTTDYLIYTDSTANAIAITLPPPTAGRLLIIQDKSGTAATNNITVKQNAAEKLNGLNQYVLAQNYNGMVLTSDGTNWSVIVPPASGSLFITAGTTYTTPANVTPQTRFKFTLIGGGGGGGGINTANAKGSGGGSGGTCIAFVTGLAASTGYTTAIGAAGVGGISTTTAATAGGNTTILINATTYTANGGAGGANTTQSNGGVGGTASNGTININGEEGGATGNASTSVVSGYGGFTSYGSGGAPISAAGTGQAGSGFGAGGSGGSGTTANGGAGTQGMILVEWEN